MSEDPAATPFPTRDRYYLIEIYNTHRKGMLDAEGVLNNAMSKTFTDKMKLIYWKVTLINFLKYQPGRNEVPLNYVVHDNFKPIARNNPNFFDDYDDRNPLQGKHFTHDA